MANQTISGLNSLSSPSSAGLLWISDPNASPQDRSFSLANFWAYILNRINTGTLSALRLSGALQMVKASGGFTTVGNITSSGALRLLKDINITSGALRSVGGIDAGNTGAVLKKRIVNIGDWNMNSTASVAVAHGLTLTKIRSVTFVIRNDTDDGYYGSFGPTPTLDGSSAPAAYVYLIGAANITLNRPAGSLFASVAFDSTGYNRGYITIEYIP